MKLFNCLQIEIQNQVGVLTLNREAQLNALNAELISELEEALKEIRNSNQVRALIVTGKGKAFAAGADIKEMQHHTPAQAAEMAEKGQRVFSHLEDAPYATIAAVNGFALGGGLELALSCDIMIAAKTAKVGLPEVSLGLIPGYGGTQRLSRAVGAHRAKYLILSGAAVAAEQAFELGLFAQICDPAELMAEAHKLAQTIASRGPKAVQLAKSSIRKGLDLPFDQGLALEAQKFSSCFGTQDAKEGLTAFIEKRPAQFRGE